MLIRCDRCSTLYELDEALLSPEGSPVQCTRCDHVFTARPAARHEPEAPPTPPPDRFEPPPERFEPPPPHAEQDEPADEPLDEPPAPPASAPTRHAAPPQRWDRPGPPVYRPGTAPSVPGVAQPPRIRRDAVGAFEARLRRSARWRWLAPALVVLALAAIVAAWILLSHRHGPVADRLRTEGLALVALDDAASLEQAVARFDEALRSAPRRREVEADRALAQALAATALLEDGKARSARAAARTAARAAALAAAPAEVTPAAPGAAPPAAAAAAPAPPEADPETARIEAEARDRTARGTALSRSALEALKRLEAEHVAPPEVARALALLHAAAGEREAVQRQVAIVRGRAPDDPWGALAEATLDARARDRAAREGAVTALSALATAHPELLRGRYLLAVAEAGLGRRAEAQSAVEGVLAANPRHERAEALRAELARPPPAPATAPGAPTASAGNGASPARKVASQPAAPQAVAPPVAPTEPSARAPGVPRAARSGASAPAHPTTDAAAPAGQGDAPSGAVSPSPAGASAPAAGAAAIPPRLRPRPAPPASTVEYGEGR